MLWSLARTQLFINQADREKLQMKRMLQESKRVPQAKGFDSAWLDGDGEYQVRRRVSLSIKTAREWLLSFALKYSAALTYGNYQLRQALMASQAESAESAAGGVGGGNEDDELRRAMEESRREVEKQEADRRQREEHDEDLMRALRESELAAGMPGSESTGDGSSAGGPPSADEREKVFQIREAGFWDLTEEVVLELLRRNQSNAERVLNALIDGDLGNLTSVVQMQLSGESCSSAAPVTAMPGVGAEEMGGGGSKVPAKGTKQNRQDGKVSKSNDVGEKSEKEKEIEMAALAALGLDDSSEEEEEEEEEELYRAGCAGADPQTGLGLLSSGSCAPGKLLWGQEDVADDEEEMLNLLLA